MKVLITGVRGQLGYDVVKRLNELQIENKGIDIDDCDLTNAAQTMEVISAYHPDCVVHCAAYTAVEKAESNAELCRRVNVDGTRNVAQACKQLDGMMVYISTDYVFPGDGEHAYDVDDPKAPLSVYGQTKYEGEQLVRELVNKHFIVRTSWVFGLNGNNFVKTMLRLGREKEQLCVVNDQIGSPTYTVDLAKLLCDMIHTKHYGIYHATNEGLCSWYEFAKAIMELAELPCKVVPISTAEYNADVQRPLNSRLSKRSLIKGSFALLPAWENALPRYLAELNAVSQSC